MLYNKFERSKKMKAKEVLKLLRCSRPSLTKYLKQGKLKAKLLDNGYYDYEEKSVYDFLNKDISRKTVIYARVSTKKQKNDLKNQIELLKNFCVQNGYTINEVYSDIASGITFENRIDLFKLIDEIIDNKIEKIIITYKDRLSRIGFDFFKTLFNKFGCEIIVISEVGSNKLDREEIFEEIISLLHCYSMKMYSKRKNNKIKELISEE
jgi:predicted site-specific integrase-resolvase